MSDDGRAATMRRREWRQRWIARFAARQGTVRRWISCADLVEWCAQSATATSHAAEEAARDLAWHRLAEAIARGEFEQKDKQGRLKSKVLYLDGFVDDAGHSPRCRLTREQFEIAASGSAAAVAHFGISGSALPLTVLNCCWLPREMARQWVERHGYHWAAHFEPPGLAASAAPKVQKATRAAPFWDEAHRAAVRWLDDEGCPAPNDGGQAVLERHIAEWLREHGYQASEAAIRRHVGRWIAEDRARRGI